LKTKLIFIALVLCSQISHAIESLNPQTISVIEMGWAGEGVYVHTNQKYEATKSCGGTTARMPQDNLLFRENLSVLLSAFHADSNVRLIVDGCLGSSMHLKAVRIEK